MLDFNKNSNEFYADYINKELYKSKFSLFKTTSFGKLVFIKNINKSSYWFPAGSGNLSSDKDDKLRAFKRFSKNSIYSFDGFNFLSSFEIYINSKFNVSVFKVLESPLFKNYVSLLNEISRKQEIKKSTQEPRMYRVDNWKYRYYNRYSSLKYYYNFEPHRNLIRIKKFNFLTLYNWIPVKRWLFTYRNMRNFYLKRRKIQKFEFKFYRAPGMSLRYWAKQQLQFNYFNSNSSDFLADPYSSNIFSPSQLAFSNSEFSFLLGDSKYDYLHVIFLYWVFFYSKDNSTFTNLFSHFANSYTSNQVSNSSKHKSLKNFYAYSTPKQAHVFYNKLNDSYGGWSELRNYFSFFKPSYWNLRRGFDMHPHEHWLWEDVLWWEDHVPIFFNRFNPKRREHRFAGLAFIDSNNIHWFYKSWLHEDLYTELHASYYRTYYNIDYLTPGWRISTDFPKKRMGHFDPKWQERLQEYVIYPYMDIFYPSTKRYYIDYFNHPDYIDSRSFLVLNFAWKLSTLSPFHFRFPSKFRKVIRSVHDLEISLDKFKPQFFFNNNNFINFLPIFFINNKTRLFLNEYLTNLTFLVNVFVRSNKLVSLTPSKLDYLFLYLNNLGVLEMNKARFNEIILIKDVSSYEKLFDRLVDVLFLSNGDLLFHRERIIAEYVAFKRFYSLLISEYGNMK